MTNYEKLRKMTYIVLNWLKYECCIYTYFDLNYKRSDNYREFYMDRFMKVE